MRWFIRSGGTSFKQTGNVGSSGFGRPLTTGLSAAHPLDNSLTAIGVSCPGRSLWGTCGSWGVPVGSLSLSEKNNKKRSPGCPWGSWVVPVGVLARKTDQKGLPWGSLGLLGDPCGVPVRKTDQEGVPWGSWGILGGPSGVPVRKTDQKGVPWGSWGIPVLSL